MLGGSVSDLNAGQTNPQTGIFCCPATTPEPTTLPQLTATVYYDGVALDPQPTVLWELSCSDLTATIDQSGNITRRVAVDCSGVDSNGGVTNGALGAGLVQVTATVLRADGSKSGVLGTLNVVLQQAAPRQTKNAPYIVAGNPFPNAPAAWSYPSIPSGSFNLVDPSLIGENY